MTSAGETRVSFHEVRVSRDADSWKVTVSPAFPISQGLPFVACMPIGVQATNGTVVVPAKEAGTHEDP